MKKRSIVKRLASCLGDPNLDSLDGEEESRAGGGPDPILNTSSSDDVDKEEEEGRARRLLKKLRMRGVASIESGSDNLESENTSISTATTNRHLHHQRHSIVLEDYHPVGLEDNELYRDDEVKDDVDFEENPLREEIAEEAMHLVRHKVRHSLDIPSVQDTFCSETFKRQIRTQTLPIWQPSFDAKSVGRILILFSMITLPLALYMIVTNLHSSEYRFEFGEECKNTRNYMRVVRRMCVFCGGNLNPSCSKQIIIPDDIVLPVFVYYEISNYYQNLRSRVQSIDNDQLRGEIFDEDGNPREPDSDCAQFSKDPDGKIYFPCGRLANEFYTDSFSLLNDKGLEVIMRQQDISMDFPREIKFQNPSMVSVKDYYLRRKFTDNFVKPQDWSTHDWDRWWKEGGMENEHFVNWMSPSAMPVFRKLFAVIDTVPDCSTGYFCKGIYTLNIEYRWDAEKYGATKAFILATTSPLGGQNWPIAMLVGVIGCVELFIGIFLMRLPKLSNWFRHHYHKHRIREAVDEDELNLCERCQAMVRSLQGEELPPSQDPSAAKLEKFLATGSLDRFDHKDPILFEKAAKHEGLTIDENGILRGNRNAVVSLRDLRHDDDNLSRNISLVKSSTSIYSTGEDSMDSDDTDSYSSIQTLVSADDGSNTDSIRDIHKLLRKRHSI